MAIITYEDGSSYNGDLLYGQFHGEGTFTWASGISYTGAWVDGARTGEGTLTWADGDIYSGEFVDGNLTGEGTYTYTSGAISEGTFLNGVLNGVGAWTYASGDVYEGTFVNGVLNGVGSKTWANGDKYEGEFVDWVVSGGLVAGKIPYFAGTAVVAKTKSEIATTDALLFDETRAWASNETYDNGSSTTITYSFLASNTSLLESDYSKPDPKTDSVLALNNTQQAAVKFALEEFSEIANITFEEVAETAAEVGTMRFGFTDYDMQIPDDGGDAWGWASPPWNSAAAGDIWINTRSQDLNWAKGSSQNFTSLLHEIGHALGLAHPFEGDDRLTKDQDFKNYTVMSYTEPKDADGTLTAWSDGNYLISSTPMVYDIAAIQYLYGASSHNAGDTVYKYDPDTPFAEAIWDSAGYDTLDLSDFTKACRISLVPGAYSTIVCNDWTMTDNLGIAFGAVIEKAIGGSGDDIIIGNSVNNTLYGGLGDDTLTGGAGNDILVGGTGIDTFSYAKGDGNDTLIAFEEGVDQISYSGFTSAEEAQFATTTTAEGHTLITLSDGSTLLKREVASTQNDLSGTILSRGGSALSDLSITADLAGSSTDLTTTSSSTGTFTLKIDNGADVSLLADMTHLNSSPTAAITELDVLEALRLSLGLTKVDGSNTAFDYMAADFNKNGKVTTKDALDILNYFHGTGDLEADWVFVDSNGDYSGLTKSNVSYTEGITTTNMSNDFVVSMTGVLLGDVDDTYTGYLDIVQNIKMRTDAIVIKSPNNSSPFSPPF